MKRAWIPLTLKSVINVTLLSTIKFYWEDEHQNILATPKINTIGIINNIVTNNNRKLSHS